MSTTVIVLLALAGWFVSSLALGLIVGRLLRHGTLRGLLRRGSR